MMIVPLYINQALYVPIVLTLFFRNCFQQGQHPCGDSRAQFENITAFGNGQFDEILTCRSESEIVLSTIKWIDLMNMEIDISDSEKFTTTDNKLTVKNVEPADEGVYKCMFNGNEIGNDEYCLTVQGIPTLISSDCINNICSVNVSYNSSYTIFASFVNRYVGFDQSVANVERVQLVMDGSQLSVCLQMKCQDGSTTDITGHNDNYPNVTFHVPNIIKDETYSLEATVANIQSETLTYVFSVMNTSSLSSIMESISSTSMFSTNPPPTPVTMMTSTTTDSTTIPSSSMSPIHSTSQGAASLNTTGIAVGVVVAVVVAFLVVILVLIMIIIFNRKRSKSITKYNMNNNMCATSSINQTEPSTLGGEDHFELDHKKNSEPRSV